MYPETVGLEPAGDGKLDPVSTGRVGSGRWPAAPVVFVAVGVALAAGGCTGDSSVVSPKGPAAHSVAGLWWPMLVVATAVFAFVAGMLLLAAARGRRRTEEQANPRVHVCCDRATR